MDINNTGSVGQIKTVTLFGHSWLAILNMLWISVITFWVPAFIPYLMKYNRSYVGYMNSIFLIFPPIGAAATALFKIYNVTLLTLAQTIIFIFTLIPVFCSSRDALHHYPIPALYFLMITFSLLSGYCTTMVYLLVRRNLSAFDPVSVEKVSRWAAFANQIGAMIGSFGTMAFVKAGLYCAPM